LLIWINGAHGAGKSSVARVLASRIPDARIVDPEQIGFMLRRLMPSDRRLDFKDDRLWRKLTLEVLCAAAAETSKTIMVPMTLANKEYHEEIVGGLTARGLDVRHFTLLATPSTLRSRLLKRISWPASTRWSLARIDSCVRELRSPNFAVHVHTDGRKIPDIAAEILSGLQSVARP
jgi:hypothetical protein